MDELKEFNDLSEGGINLESSASTNSSNEKIEVSKSEFEAFKKFQEMKKEKTTEGMVKTAEKGNVVSRAPFGYDIVEKKLVPAGNADEIKEIFEEFLNTSISLNQLSKKHNLTVNGLKKILNNFAYIGKVRFNSQLYQGNHQPIISTTLFNHVQNKLERLREKKKDNKEN